MPDLAQSHTCTKKETQQHSVPTFAKSHTFLWAGCVVAGLLFSGILIKISLRCTAYMRSNLLRLHGKRMAVMPGWCAGIESYQNALITEIVPVDTLTKKQVFRQATKSKPNKLVQLEANDYRVGLLGGIKTCACWLSINQPFSWKK
jgi:hypothetical protein